MQVNQKPILIIGGQGKTGMRVDAQLKQKGYVTRPVSRSTTIPFDWEQPSTWSAALDGVGAAYITYQPDLAVPRALATIEALGAEAAAAGLEHLVLLSGRGEAGAQRAEEALKACGVPWTIVRASWFAQNFSEGFMVEGILNGELCLPAAEIPEPFIDIDDIADVVVAALTEPGHQGKCYEVTGPQALTFHEAVAMIAENLGRPLAYTQVPIEPFLLAMQEQGLPEEMLWLFRELFTKVLDGRNVQVMHGVEQALGRKPTDFQTYIRKALASGAWVTSSKQEVLV